MPDEQPNPILNIGLEKTVEDQRIIYKVRVSKNMWPLFLIIMKAGAQAHGFKGINFNVSQKRPTDNPNV